MNRRIVTGVASVPFALSLSLACSGNAYAEFGSGGGGREGTGGGANGNSLTASATHTQIEVSKEGGSESSSSPVSPVDSDWTPPLCWYEPVATPKQLKKAAGNIEPGSNLIPVTPTLSWGDELIKGNYGKKSKYSKYGDYNVSQQGKGKWYRGVINPNREEDWDFDSCEKNLFWVPNGEKPEVPEMVSPKVLAEYAYDEIQVPNTQVEMAPAGKSLVNLPTWMWLDKKKFKPVKVRATLPGTGQWAETTAKPVGLHLDPGTSDARTHPASGDCEIKDDGSIGTAYKTGDADKTPPCGVTYERSTHGSGPHKLTATLKWKISWRGSDGQGGQLPDGAFDSTQNVTVQERQTVVR